MSPATLGLGRLPDPPDERDHLWRAAVPKGAVELPPSYHVALDPGPVLDQGQTSMCVAYSGAAIRTTEEYLDDGLLRSFDTEAYYRRCKALDGYPDADGTIIRIALGIAKDEGVPSIPANGGPTEHYKISSYTRLTSIQQIKESLVTDGPVQFGIDLDECFSAVGPDGILPPPTGRSLGGHAMAIYGYDDAVAGGAFRVRNSWGAEWGEGGWCWVPYGYFEAFPGWDAWRLTDLPNIAPDEKVVVEPTVVENVCPTCGQPLSVE